MHWTKLAGVAAALVGGFVLATTQPAAATQNTTCETVFTSPQGQFFRIAMGTNFTTSIVIPMSIDGVVQNTTTNIDVDVVSTQPRVTCTIDLGGGDTWTFGADMTAVTSTYYTFTDADSFVGTGKYAGATGTFTFLTNTGPSEFTTASGFSDGPNVFEWAFEGEVCVQNQTTDDVCEKGKIASLLLRYTGLGPAASNNTQDSDKTNVIGDAVSTTPVRIRVTSHEDPFQQNAAVYFDGTVTLNSTYTADIVTAGLDKFKGQTFVHIFDSNDKLLESDEFHTSCSQPLNVGDEFGSTEIVGFTNTPANAKGAKSKKNTSPSGTKSSKSKKSEKSSKSKKSKKSEKSAKSSKSKKSEKSSKSKKSKKSKK